MRVGATSWRPLLKECRLEYPEPELKPPDWVSRELTREMQRRAREVEPDQPELEMVHSAVPAS